jgi:hypothetical protein
MILTKEIEVSITSRNITYYREFGYKVELGSKINVPVEHLSKSSKLKIKCQCELCDTEGDIIYEKYLINYNRHNFYSCKKCSNKKRVMTVNEKYGVDNYSQTDEYREKVETTNMEKYGVKTTLLNPETQEKIKKTNIERYGTKHPLQSQVVRNKGKETFLEKYGVDHYSKSDEFKNHMSNNIWKNDLEKRLSLQFGDKFKINKENNNFIIDCINGHTFETNWKLQYQREKLYNVEPCTICNPISSGVSGSELKIIEFIKENYNGQIIEGDRKILNKKELDIYLPDLNIAIEYNGLYWHSEAIKENYYHYNKTVECEKLGIQLIHIYEDEWNYKRDVVKSRLLNILKKTPNRVYARKCKIVNVDSKTSKQFLIHNHIQGNVYGKVNLGLVYQDKLVALMNFGGRRKNLGGKAVEGEYELLRFCNKLNTNVVGGASKLFQHFVNTFKPTQVISYADRSWSMGGLYNSLGFTFDSYTKPNYFYIEGDTRLNRFNFRKDILVSQGYDANKTEHVIMLERGYLRIYNSGNMKFKMEFI